MTTRLHAVYDAWNRMVVVRNDNSGSAGTLIVSYCYDGLNHRIRKIVAGGDSFNYYHNEQWQVLEVRKNEDTDPLKQWVWDIRYVDAPVVRFRDSNTDGTVDDTLYVTQDANFNVTALVNASSGAVVERYAYSPYGMRIVLDGSFGARGSSSYDFELGHQGKQHDFESGLVHNNARYLHPSFGRFTIRDLIVYGDGMNPYQYVGGNPATLLDPFGLAATTQSSAACAGICDDLKRQLAAAYSNRNMWNQSAGALMGIYVDAQETFMKAEAWRGAGTLYLSWLFGGKANPPDIQVLSNAAWSEIEKHAEEQLRNSRAVKPLSAARRLGVSSSVFAWQYYMHRKAIAEWSMITPKPMNARPLTRPTIRGLGLNITWLVAGLIADSKQQTRMNNLISIAKQYVEADVNARFYGQQIDALEQLLDEECPE